MSAQLAMQSAVLAMIDSVWQSDVDNRTLLTRRMSWQRLRITGRSDKNVSWHCSEWPCSSRPDTGPILTAPPSDFNSHANSMSYILLFVIMKVFCRRSLMSSCYTTCSSWLRHIITDTVHQKTYHTLLFTSQCYTERLCHGKLSIRPSVHDVDVRWSHNVIVVQWLGVGLVIERLLVRLPARALSSQLGQLSLPSLRGR